MPPLTRILREHTVTQALKLFKANETANYGEDILREELNSLYIPEKHKDTMFCFTDMARDLCVTYRIYGLIFFALFLGFAITFTMTTSSIILILITAFATYFGIHGSIKYGKIQMKLVHYELKHCIFSEENDGKVKE